MHLRTLLFVFLLVLMASTAVLAEANEEPIRQPNLLELNDQQALRLAPILQQIRRVMASSHEEIASMEARIAASKDPQQVRTLERQVVDSKLVMEIRVLEIQAEFAEREGRQEEADNFTALAQGLQNPARRQPAVAVPERQEESR